MSSDTLITGRRRIRSLMVAVTVAVSVSSCGDGTGSTATAVSVTAADSSAATSVAGPSVTTGSTVTTAVSPTAVSPTTTVRSSTTKATERPTVHDLERDLEDTINDDGTYPGRATCEATGALSDWQTVLCYYQPDVPGEFGGIHVAIFDRNRYAWALGECCAVSPWPEEYPPGLLCRDLLEPPRESHYQPDSNNLSYGLAVFYWVKEGRPERMDADRNGVPCETVYPKGEVDEYWASVRVLP